MDSEEVKRRFVVCALSSALKDMNSVLSRVFNSSLVSVALLPILFVNPKASINLFEHVTIIKLWRYAKHETCTCACAHSVAKLIYLLGSSLRMQSICSRMRRVQSDWRICWRSNSVPVGQSIFGMAMAWLEIGKCAIVRNSCGISKHWTMNTRLPRKLPATPLCIHECTNWGAKTNRNTHQRLYWHCQWK